MNSRWPQGEVDRDTCKCRFPLRHPHRELPRRRCVERGTSGPEGARGLGDLPLCPERGLTGGPRAQGQAAPAADSGPTGQLSIPALPTEWGY